MKRIYKTFPLLLLGCALTAACSSDWDDHYDEHGISLTGDTDVLVTGSTVSQYIQGAADLTELNQVLTDNGVYDETYSDGQYTFIVCDDNYFDASQVSDMAVYAQHCVSDIGVSPSKLTDGSNIMMRSGKSIWVTGNGTMLDGLTITKKIKAANGYIYYVNGVLPVRQSAYELLLSLGSEYSRFKELVLQYNYDYFDRESSLPIGVTEDGRTVYDSVNVVKNTLMDRYDEDGTAIWNMRSESYSTTMFIPNNTLIDEAINAAMDSIPLWLHREATDDDREKFEQWVVKACFSDQWLDVDFLSQDTIFECVGGYQQDIDSITDQTTYSSVDAAWWKTSVQKVDLGNAVQLSNGMAYYCQTFKIPNHIVIYRVKSRLYEIWDNSTDQQHSTYFRWSNLSTPYVCYNMQSQFDMTFDGVTSTIYYHCLCALPSEEAMEDDLPVSIEYDGLTWDDTTQQIYECNLPAGEYYLRMGFKHSLLYSLSIAFNDEWLVEDMNMHATGSDFHFDRGAASEVPHYGESFGIAYPEGFDVDYWQNYDEKAIAWDTDGYTVGIVTLQNSGNFRIRVTSNDLARNYKTAMESGSTTATYTSGSDANSRDVNQLVMYHWCLRPTYNNY